MLVLVLVHVVLCCFWRNVHGSRCTIEKGTSKDAQNLSCADCTLQILDLAHCIRVRVREEAEGRNVGRDIKRMSCVLSCNQGLG